MYRYDDGKLYRYNNTQSVNAYFYKYDHEVRIKELERYDDYAKREIDRCLELIESIKEYRQDLAAYVQNLFTIQPTLELRLIREVHYKGNKYYNVGVFEVYPQGEKAVISERFKGTERKKAFDLFEQLKKQYPGIKTIKDTEKRSWEK